MLSVVALKADIVVTPSNFSVGTLTATSTLSPLCKLEVVSETLAEVACDGVCFSIFSTEPSPLNTPTTTLLMVFSVVLLTSPPERLVAARVPWAVDGVTLTVSTPPCPPCERVSSELQEAKSPIVARAMVIAMEPKREMFPFITVLGLRVKKNNVSLLLMLCCEYI